MKGLKMPKELKPGWDYFSNDNPIGLEYAVHKESGWVYFEDGVKYNPEEINILIESGNPVSKSLHTVKKVFQGEIVRYEQGSETNNKESPGSIVPAAPAAAESDNTAEKQLELEIW
jgi:hypothetical protein